MNCRFNQSLPITKKGSWQSWVKPNLNRSIL
nr:MAG TPA: hypothetical protein [Caudoviricetes sp.]